MKILIGIIISLVSFTEGSAVDEKSYNKLSPEEERVIIHKGTEPPFSGKYNDFFAKGTYQCKQCSAPLYSSNDKFESSCGWPSFDNEIKGAIKRETDADGIRTEILCANCGGHLGHVFEGERLTDKNVRHCVNSVSMLFIPYKKSELAKAHFAGGCFWGIEHLFKQKEGVVSAVSGYMGGTVDNPTYGDVLQGDTGHLETVEVTYDPSKVNYEDLAQYFFEIHDPTQVNGQGPDIGEQYLSAIFCNDDDEKNIAHKLINILNAKGYEIATKVLPSTPFWKAEEYHQNYYNKNRQKPYCHVYENKF
tara:strand:- start:652 stop:1566 length:915 start_codon:yes stop_codon:yes gene_type:complete